MDSIRSGGRLLEPRRATEREPHRSRCDGLATPWSLDDPSNLPAFPPLLPVSVARVLLLFFGFIFGTICCVPTLCGATRVLATAALSSAHRTMPFKKLEERHRRLAEPIAQAAAAVQEPI